MSKQFREVLAVVLMLGAVLAVYWNPKPPATYQGVDYSQLHTRRMQFAREALFGPAHTLPAWYPRELLGTPFWSNIQNFPFIPNRLVILALDPDGPYTYTLAITLAASLGAFFTYLYCRRIGLGMTGSASAGWTFVCCGYFAARVLAGHLPLLEAYCALPLLLWTVESLAQSWHSNGQPTRRWIVALALSCCCVMLAGHPQLPVYSLIVAAIYALWRLGIRRCILAWSAMGLGIGCAMFALFPMTLLIGRSTRILPLAAPENDLAMPYRRLLAFFVPWLDGAPRPLRRWQIHPFQGYALPAHFWDTVCYAGWMPWLAVVLLAVLLILKRVRLQSRAAVFVILLGVAGLVLAMPFVQRITALVPATLLRSPARLIYLTEFSLAIALGAAIHLIMVSPLNRTARWAVPAVLLFIHAIDVSVHASEFLDPVPADYRAISDAVAPLLEHVRDGRIAIDDVLLLRQNRAQDDVGFFDSIMLARPYRLLMDLTAAVPDLNIQNVSGSQLSRRALETCGVMVMITLVERPDLTMLSRLNGTNLLAIPAPAARTDFFDAAQIQYLDPAQIHDRTRDESVDLRDTLFLPIDAPHLKVPAPDPSPPPKVNYRRPDTDHIECTVDTARPGYLRIIESWDTGWSATIDGIAIPIVPALDALLSVPVNPGKHEVRFVYHTPGALVGAMLSIVSLTALVILLIFIPGRQAEAAPRIDHA